MKPLLLALLLTGTATSALAQNAPGVVARVDKLEKEMRAVQRKVFPGGAYLEPEIRAPTAAPDPTGLPAAAPIADLTARVSSLEQELARMTGQIEQNGFKLRQLEEQVARLKEMGTRLDALEGGPALGGAAPAPGRPAVSPPPADAGEPPADPAPVAEGETAAPPPASADPGEDAYLAAYRKWADKDYAGAEADLKAFVARYPRHKRASFAQNLLGRTYLDSGKPAAAAVAFHANYTKNPRGERAPDSLYYLGQSLMRLPTPQAAKACEAYAALLREYGASVGSDLKAKVAKGQADAKCAV